MITQESWDAREALFKKELNRANKLAHKFEKQAIKNQEKLRMLLDCTTCKICEECYEKAMWK